MNEGSSDIDRREIPFSSLVPFVLITFGLAWGILGLYIFLPEVAAGIFGEISGRHPLFYLAVYAPAIAALIIIVLHSGGRGLRRFIGRLLLWRCSLGWYAFLLFGIPLCFVGGSLIKGNLLEYQYPFASLQALAVALAFTLIKGPIEEFGWRGLALPLLQRWLAPVWAALVLGLVWGVWHVPAFLLSGTQQSAWSFTPFLVGTVAISVIVTSLFNSSRGSVLLAGLVHFQLIHPLWPDAQPYDTYLFVAVALAVVVVNRKSMFSRAGAWTEVIPQPEKRGDPGATPVDKQLQV